MEDPGVDMEEAPPECRAIYCVVGENDDVQPKGSAVIERATSAQIDVAAGTKLGDVIDVIRERLGNVKVSYLRSNAVWMEIKAAHCDNFKFVKGLTLYLRCVRGSGFKATGRTSEFFPRWETVELKERLEELSNYPDNTMYSEVVKDEQGEEEGGVTDNLSWKYLHFRWDWLNAVWGADVQKILERRCYTEIWQVILEAMEAGTRSFIVLGNPGVGKSGMLIWVIQKLMASHKKIILQTKNGSQSRFTGSDTYDIECGDFTSDLAFDSSIYFLVDGSLPKPPPVAGITLLCCSPESRNYHELYKDGRGGGALKLYMPVWSFAEILVAQQECFARRWDVVLSKYKDWGGIPRYVLEKVQEQTDDLLRDAIEGCSKIAEVVEAAVTGVADKNHPSHKVMHMQVAEGYLRYRYRFASRNVREKVFARLHAQHKSSLFSFLVTTNDTSLHSFKGELLQLLVKEKLPAGGVYKVKEVFPGRSPATETVKVIQKMRLFEYDGQVDKANLPDGVERLGLLFWPKGKQISFDCCWLEDREDGVHVCAGQITYSSQKDKHGIKRAGIDQLVEKFGVGLERIEVYVMTPAELFSAADHQFWAGSKNARLRAVHVLNALNKAKQLVLAFPIE